MAAKNNKSYEKEESRHDRVSKKENTRHEKFHDKDRVKMYKKGKASAKKKKK
jgi:hypothetical protein